MKKIWARGGVAGFYQGLIPWVSGITHGRRVCIHRRQGWFEASTKGAILLLSASEAERLSLKVLPTQTALAGSVGGLVGGLMQAYAVMGFTTTMVSLSQPRKLINVDVLLIPDRKQSRLPAQRPRQTAEGLRQLSEYAAISTLKRAFAGSTRASTRSPFAR